MLAGGRRRVEGRLQRARRRRGPGGRPRRRRRSPRAAGRRRGWPSRARRPGRPAAARPGTAPLGLTGQPGRTCAAGVERVGAPGAAGRVGEHVRHAAAQQRDEVALGRGRGRRRTPASASRAPGRASPAMSPTAGAVMISAPGRRRVAQLHGPAGHRGARAVEGVDVLVHRRWRRSRAPGRRVRSASTGAAKKPRLTWFSRVRSSGRRSSGFRRTGKPATGVAVELPGVDVLARGGDDLGRRSPSTSPIAGVRSGSRGGATRE